MDYLNAKLDKISASACSSPKPSGRTSPLLNRRNVGQTKSSGDQPKYVWNFNTNVVIVEVAIQTEFHKKETYEFT